MIDGSASSNGLKVNAGKIEGEIIGEKALTANELEAALTKAGVTEQGGKYFHNGEPLNITVGPGQKVQWKISEINTAYSTIYEVEPTVVSANARGKSTIIYLRRNNPEARNSYIEQNSKAVSDLVHRLRQSDDRMTSLQSSISAGNYDMADVLFHDIFSASRDKTAQGLIAAQSKLSNPAEKQAFYTQLLAKTQGGRESRNLASRGDIAATRKYFDTLAPTFAKQFGISTAEAKAHFENSINSRNTTTLGAQFPNGFTALVAYSQISK